MYRAGEWYGLVGWRGGLEGIEDRRAQLLEVSFIAGGDGQVVNAGREVMRVSLGCSAA